MQNYIFLNDKRQKEKILLRYCDKKKTIFQNSEIIQKIHFC